MPGAEKTYRAVHAVGPGKLELTEKPLLDPLAGYVRIRVEACGVCHSDSATVEGDLADRVAEGARPRGRRTDRSGRRGCGRLGGGSTRRRRLPRRQLRALRILPRRRSCELRKPGLHWSAAERRLRRGD